MRTLRMICALLFVLWTLPLFAEQQTWKDVSVIDSMCVSKAKADPDKHPKDVCCNVK